MGGMYKTLIKEFKLKMIHLMPPLSQVSIYNFILMKLIW